MGAFYQMRFITGTSSQNFPISINIFNEFPVNTMFNSSHLDIQLVAYGGLNNPNNDRLITLFHNKFRLLIKLFMDYRLNIEKLKPNIINYDDLRTKLPNVKIINFDDSKYMNSAIDSAQNELLEHLDELGQNRLKTAIPNMINWMDANIGKNSSGFCDLRNAYLHPDLWEKSKEELQKRFSTMVFNPDGSIARDSEENIRILETVIDPILKEIKNAFIKKYLFSEELPYKKLMP